MHSRRRRTPLHFEVREVISLAIKAPREGRGRSLPRGARETAGAPKPTQSGHGSLAGGCWSWEPLMERKESLAIFQQCRAVVGGGAHAESHDDGPGPALVWSFLSISGSLLSLFFLFLLSLTLSTIYR